MVRRDWTPSANIHDYSTLNNEHNWKDLYIQLRNQQTYTSDNHNQLKGRSNFTDFSS